LVKVKGGGGAFSKRVNGDKRAMDEEKNIGGERGGGYSGKISHKTNY